MEKKRIITSLSNTILDIGIKEGNRWVFREKVNINNEKNMAKVFNLIKIKFGYDLVKMVEEYNGEDWFKY